MGTLLSTERCTQLQARLASKIAILDKLYDLLDGLSERKLERYRLDTEDGTMQLGHVRNPSQIEKMIDRLERSIDSIQRKLNGESAANMALRRYP